MAVVLLNWNGLGLLQRFLPGLCATDYPNLRILLADNGSTDASLQWVRQHHPTVEVLELGQNHGFAQGNNLAMQHVHEAFAVLLNTDVEVPPNWLKPLVEWALHHPRAAAVQPKVLCHADPKRFEHAGAAGGFIDRLGYPFARGRVLHHLEEDHGQYDQPAQCFWASGACLLLRTQAVQEVGLFDARFFAHMEEIDFCWRAQLAGWQVWCQPQSRVWHIGGGTLPQTHPQKLYLNLRNSLWMLCKNLPAEHLAPRITRRMLLDGLLGIAYALRFKWRHVQAILRAHRHFRTGRALALDQRPAKNPPPLESLPGAMGHTLLVQAMILRRRSFSSIWAVWLRRQGSAA